jgi:hypothetical protein
MELTIIQNGALYAMQHRPLRKFRSTRRKQAVANKLIRTDQRRPERLADRNIKTEAVCFI